MKGVFYVLIILPFWGYAQYEVSGVVRDSAGFISYANVRIMQEGRFVKGGITDAGGSFLLSLEEGVYDLAVSYVGYETYETTIEVVENLALKDILLRRDVEMLDEIVVVGEANIIERKADKLVFNVENSPVKSGFDGVEVLRRAPGVFVNGRGNILVRDKHATVLINGRKLNLSGDELTNYLKSIDAGSIRRIEIQSTASSNMDANIQGGVINFILKKKRMGLLIQVKAYQMQKGKRPNFYSSANMNYGAEKWNLYGALSFEDAQDSGVVISSAIYNAENRQLKEHAGFLENSKRFTFTLGATYQPTEKHELALELYSTTMAKVNKSSSEIETYENNLLLDRGVTEALTNGSTRYLDASVNYSIKIDTLGGALSFIADYASQNFENAFDAGTTYAQAYYDDIIERSATNSSTGIVSAQIDFVRNVGKVGEFSSGVKFTNTRREDETIGEDFVNGGYQIAEDRTDAYYFQENIYAGYLAVSKNLSGGASLKLGLRVENTAIGGLNVLTNTPVSQNYLDIFPLVFVSKKIGGNHFVSFNYNRKIARPAFSVLSPYVIKINDFSYQIGNPDLGPQYVNNLEIAYGFRQHSFSVYYDLVSNLVAGIYFPDGEAVYYQSQNIGKSKVVGLNYSFGGNVSKWWYLKFSANFNARNYDLASLNYRYNDISVYVNNDWKISATWSVSLSMYYASPKIYAYLQVEDFFRSDFMIQKTFLNEKLKLRIYVDDIFNSDKDENRGLYHAFTYDFYQKRNSRSFLIYAFFAIDTNDKVRKKKSKTSNDVRNRL